MKNITILLLTLLLASCGLKKPLENPDAEYPSEPDCRCEENESKD